MGCGGSSATGEEPKVKYDAQYWKDLDAKLPTEKTEEERNKRIEIWKNNLGASGSDALTFDQIKSGMETYLSLPEAVLNKGPMKLAFDGAKDKYKTAGKEVSDDKLEWNEFRIFLIFLRQYFEYWAMFEALDASGDAQINMEEFKKAVPTIKKWGFEVPDEEALFKEIDSNNGGTISFDEFTKFAIAKALNLEEDDPGDNAAIEMLKQ